MNPPVKTVCLVRHGETDWNRVGRVQGREDIPLNETGRAQAIATGRYLRQFRWDRLICSPLQRAHETAAIIARCLETGGFAPLDDFMERDFGAASGLTTLERRARFPEGPIPGLEEVDPFRRRVMDALTALVSAPREERILVVTHGAVIGVALAAISNGEIGTSKTVLLPACLNLLSYRAPVWQIEAHNVTVHLEDKDG